MPTQEDKITTILEHFSQQIEYLEFYNAPLFTATVEEFERQLREELSENDINMFYHDMFCDATCTWGVEL